MNRLSVRLVVSHVLVALIGVVATFAVVRWLAPAMFDETLRRQTGQIGGRGPGMGGGAGGVGAGMVLREQFATAVNQALLIGAGVGILAAALFGVFAARRVIQSLGAVRAATRQLAHGNYAATVPEPKEAELAELAADVSQLGSELAQTEAHRMRLLGEVAHELRTPLTVIDGYVEAMIDKVLPTTAQNLAQITDETRRLRRLGEDLSSLSRAEEGRLGLQLQPADASRIAKAAAERLRPQIEDAQVQLEVTPGARLPVNCDSDRIAQVVTNLVGNALRATPAGGTITVTSRSDGRQALIEVADTGVGLTPAQLPRIFERFYRVNDQRIGESGSGIGLTISRGIARAHGGELTATSPGLGRGATFTLALPLNPSGAPG
ncbi:MAG: HAMP domain-containing histidine kinase [Propionicimonas sp.]